MLMVISILKVTLAPQFGKSKQIVSKIQILSLLLNTLRGSETLLDFQVTQPPLLYVFHVHQAQHFDRCAFSIPPTLEQQHA